MNESTLPIQLLFAALLGGLFGIVATLFWTKSKLSTLAVEHAGQSRLLIEEERKRASLAQQEVEARFEQRLQEQRQSALSVTVHPFVNTSTEKGIFSRETTVEIGYKYQLFVQGLPCFEPHSVVVESSVHKEVNEETLDMLKSRALDAAEAAIQIKSGGVASKVISIAKAAIKYAK